MTTVGGDFLNAANALPSKPTKDRTLTAIINRLASFDGFVGMSTGASANFAC
jgi:hypothetical protein